MIRAQRLKEIGKLALEPDAVDLRGVTIKDALTGIGLGLFVAFVGALQVALGAWQLVVSLLLAGYDLVEKGLKKLVRETTAPES